MKKNYLHSSFFAFLLLKLKATFSHQVSNENKNSTLLSFCFKRITYVVNKIENCFLEKSNKLALILLVGWCLFNSAAYAQTCSTTLRYQLFRASLESSNNTSVFLCKNNKMKCVIKPSLNGTLPSDFYLDFDYSLVNNTLQSPSYITLSFASSNQIDGWHNGVVTHISLSPSPTGGITYPYSYRIQVPSAIHYDSIIVYYFISLDCNFTNPNIVSQSTVPQIEDNIKLYKTNSSTFNKDSLYGCFSNNALTANYASLQFTVTYNSPATGINLSKGSTFFRTINVTNFGIALNLNKSFVHVVHSRLLHPLNEQKYIRVRHAYIDFDGNGIGSGNEAITIQPTINGNEAYLIDSTFLKQKQSIGALSGILSAFSLPSQAGGFNIIEDCIVDSVICTKTIYSNYFGQWNCPYNTSYCQTSPSFQITAVGGNDKPNLQYCKSFGNNGSFCYAQNITKSYSINIWNQGNAPADTVSAYFWLDNRYHNYTQYSNFVCSTATITTITNTYPASSGDAIADMLFYQNHSLSAVYKIARTGAILNSSTSCNSTSTAQNNFIISWDALTTCPPEDSCFNKTKDSWDFLVYYKKGHCDGFPRYLYNGGSYPDSDRVLPYSSYFDNGYVPSQTTNFSNGVIYRGPTMVTGSNTPPPLCKNNSNNISTAEFDLPIGSTMNSWYSPQANQAIDIELSLDNCLNIATHEVDNPPSFAPLYYADLKNQIHLIVPTSNPLYLSLTGGDLMTLSGVTCSYISNGGMPQNGAKDVIRIHIPFTYNGTSSTSVNLQNILSKAKLRIFFQPHCCCSNAGNEIAGKIYHILDTTCVPQCRILLDCFGTTVIVTCPGCKRKGVHNAQCSVKRLSYGLVDNNDDELADNPSLAANSSTPWVETKKVMFKDKFSVKQSVNFQIDNGYGPIGSIANCSNCLLPSDSIELDSTKRIVGFKYLYFRTTFTGGNLFYDAAAPSCFNNLYLTITNLCSSPLIVPFNPSIDHIQLYGGTLEVYYDLSISRLSSLAGWCGGINLFTNGMSFDIEGYYSVVKNIGATEVQATVINRAYCGLRPETYSNKRTWLVDPDLIGNMPLVPDTSNHITQTNALFDAVDDYDFYCHYLNTAGDTVLKGFDTYSYVSGENDTIAQFCDIAWYCNDNNADILNVEGYSYTKFGKVYFQNRGSNYDNPCQFQLHAYDDNTPNFFRLGLYYNEFSTEFRNWNFLRKIDIYGLPTGLTISHNQLGSYTPVSNLYTSNVPISTSSPTTIDFTSFYTAGPTFTTAQIPLPDDANSQSDVLAYLKIPCNLFNRDTTINIPVNITETFNRGISQTASNCAHLIDTTSHDVVYSYSPTLHIYKPKLNITAPLAKGAGGQACWNVVIANSSSNVTAPNSWFAFDTIGSSIKAGSINPSVSFDGGATWTSSIHNVKPLGNQGSLYGFVVKDNDSTPHSIGKNNSFMIRICVNYNCKLTRDSFKIFAGWNCTPMDTITDISSACSSVNTWMKIQTEQASMWVYDLSDYSNLQPCDTIHCIYKILNDYDYLRALTVQLSVSPTSAYSILGNTLKVAYASNTTSYATTSTGGTFQLFNMPTPLPNAPTGSSITGAVLPGHSVNLDDSVIVSFDLAIGCHFSYNSNDKVAVNFTSNNGCDTLHTNFTANPLLNSPTSIYNQLSFGNASDTAKCTNISIAIKNFNLYSGVGNDTTGIYNQLLVYLPAGVKITSVSSPSSASGSTSCGGIYTYTIPSGININGLPAFIFSFNVSACPAGVLQGNYPFKFKLVTVNPTFSCNGVSCPVFAVQDSLLLNVNIDTITITQSITNPTCHNSSNGSIHLTASGHPPYSVTMTGNGTTTTSTYSSSPIIVNSLAAGSYSFTLSDNYGCPASILVTLTNPPKIVSTQVHQNISCNGGSDGSITITTSGTPSFTSKAYLGSSTTPITTSATVSPFTIGSLSAGTYTIIITDTLGCNDTITGVALSQPTKLKDSCVILPVSCTANTGKITCYASGGTTPYTYQYQIVGGASTLPSTSNIFSNLSAGTYIVQVTDAHACIRLDTVKIPISKICGDTFVCIGSGYTYHVSNVAGAASYSWTTTSTNSTISPSGNSATIQFGDSGTFVITVVALDNSSDTLAQQHLTVHVHPVPQPVIQALGQVNCKQYDWQLNDTCWVFCDSAVIQFSCPAQSYYSYSWIALGGTIISGQGTSNVSVRFTQIGSFGISVKVKDTLAGCEQTANKCIKIVSKPQAVINSNPANVNAVIHICKNQSVTFTEASTTGASGVGYLNQWIWNDGMGNITMTNSPPAPLNVTYTNSGTYIVSLTVSTSCSCSDVAQITVIVDTASGPNIFCKTTICYDSTGTYSTSISGCGQYNWSVTNGTIISTPPYGQTIQVLWNQNPTLSAGTISLSVSGCMNYVCSGTTTVSIPILPPNAAIQSTPTTPPCPNDIVQYSVPQIPGTIYNWTVTGATVITSLNNNYILVKAGASGSGYTLTVTYSNCTLKNCSGHSTLSVHVGSLFKIVCPSGDCSISCANGSTTLSTNYPTNNFVWSIINANTNTSVGTPTTTTSFTANWSTIASSITVPTKYIITAHDASYTFCNNPDPTYAVMVYPIPPTLSPVPTVGCICANSPVNITAQPTNTNYYLSWQVTSGTGSPSNGTGNTFNSTISGALPVVSVTQILKQAPHCASAALAIPLSYCSAPTGSITGNQSVCINSSSTLTAPAGYDSYDWQMQYNTDGAIVGSSNQANVTIQWNSVTAATTYNLPTPFNILCNARYCGVVYPLTYFVNIVPPTTPILTVTPNSPICAKTTLTFTVSSSGACPLSGNYIWDFNDGTPTITTTVPTATHKYNTAGSYTVSLTAQNSTTSNLLQQATLPITVSPSPQVQLQTSGGPCPSYTLTANITQTTTTNYTYVWGYSPSLTGYTTFATTPPTTGTTTTATTDIQTAGSGQGSYQVVITDATGCTASSDVQINCSSTTPTQGCTQICSGTFNAAIQTPCTGVTNFYSSVIICTGVNYATYKLDFGDGQSVSGNAPVPSTIAHTYQHVGKYNAALYVYYNVGAPNQCQNSFNRTVVIPILPAYKMQYSCNFSPSLTATLKDISEVLNPTATYNWSGVSTNLPTPSGSSAVKGSTPTNIVYGHSNYTGSYTIHDASTNSCTVPVTFSTPAAPVAAYTIAPTTPVCAGTTVAFTDNSTSNIVGWTWGFNNSTPTNHFYSNLKNPFEAFNYDPFSSPHGKVDITLTATDNHQCQSSTSGSSLVNEKTLTGVTLGNLSGTVCAGSQANLKATIIFGGTPHPNYDFTWMNGNTVVANNPNQPNPNTQSVSQQGIYYCNVIDNNGCNTNSGGFVSPLFIQMPQLSISSVTHDVCIGAAVDFGAYVGPTSQYNYNWSIPAGASSCAYINTQPDLHIAAGCLGTVGTFTISCTVTSNTNPACSSTTNFILHVHSLPQVTSITTNPTHPCPVTGSTVILSGGVSTGGTAPFTYHWSNGSTTTNCTINQSGNYTYFVTDHYGCQSPVSPPVTIKPAPNFNQLITGCFVTCDTMPICGIFDPNYPHSTWYMGNTPVQTGGNYTPTQSGTYYLQLCDNYNCCAKSPPINVTLVDCNNCCSRDTAKVDTMYCVGTDAYGNPQFHFTMSFYNDCPYTDSLLISDANGTLTAVYPTRAAHGWQTINGLYVPSSSVVTYFCPQVVVSKYNSAMQQWTQTCEAIPANCYPIPSCNGSVSPCNFPIATVYAQCGGYMPPPTSNPLYKIGLLVQNITSSAYNYVLSSPQGVIIGGATGSLNPGNNTLNFLLEDTPPYDGVFCILLQVYDRSTGVLICQQWYCVIVQQLCPSNNGCVEEAKISQIDCYGYDSLGNNQYLISVYVYDNLNSGSDCISFICPYGLASYITPPCIAGMGNPVLVQFLYTDIANNGIFCMGIRISDTLKGTYCYADYNQFPWFCQPLPPPCPAPRMANPNAHHNSTVANADTLEGCSVRIVPNPNGGRPEIYYKYTANKNEANNVELPLTLSIVESSSGKLVFRKELPNAAGIMIWNETNALPEGHYIVLLSSKSSSLCNSKMEVVK